MSVKVGVVRVAIPAGAVPTDTLDFVAPELDGETPKAVIFFWSGNESDGSVSNCKFGTGVTDGTNNWTVGIASQDNQASSNTKSYAGDTDCVGILTHGGGLWGAYTFNSWITNGVRLTCTDAENGEFLITAMIFAGDDVSAAAGTFDPADTQDNFVDVSGTFKPDIVFGATDVNSFDEGTKTGSRFSYGMARRVDDSTSEQFSNGLWWKGSQSPTNLEGGISNICFVHEPGDGDTVGEFSIEAWNDSYFRVYTRDNNAGSTTRVGYLSLKLDGVSTSLSGAFLPTTTGSTSYSCGFQPQALLAIPTQYTSVKTWANGSDLAGFVGSYAASISGDYSHSCTHEHNVATTESNSQAQSDLSVYDDSNTIDWLTSSITFDSDGWDWNFTSVDASANVIGVLAIEEFPVIPTPTASIFYRTYRNRRI